MSYRYIESGWKVKHLYMVDLLRFLSGQDWGTQSFIVHKPSSANFKDTFLFRQMLWHCILLCQKSECVCACACVRACTYVRACLCVCVCCFQPNFDPLRENWTYLIVLSCGLFWGVERRQGFSVVSLAVLKLKRSICVCFLSAGIKGGHCNTTAWQKLHFLIF